LIGANEVLAYAREFGFDAAHRKFVTSGPDDGRGDRGDGDTCPAAIRRLLSGWTAVESTRTAEAAAHFGEARKEPQLAGWAALGDAVLAVRIKDFSRAEEMLTIAQSREGDCKFYSGIVAHVRGVKAAHEGNLVEARRWMFRSAEMLGPESYAYGRVCDALAGFFGQCDDFLNARLLYLRALQHKTRVGDRHGMAITHGGLGRLHYNWGYFEKAKDHFLADLKLAEELNDEFGRVRMQGALGQVYVQMALAESARAGTTASAATLRSAADWLAACVENARRHNFQIVEGFALKDQALLGLLRGDADQATELTSSADRIFTAAGFAEGRNHLERVRGMIAMARQDWTEARRRMQTALACFARMSDRGEEAITRLWLARLAIRSAQPSTLVERELGEALRAAEICRRTALIREVEDEFRNAAPAAYWHELFRRVRGRGIPDGATSFTEARRETATVFYLDVQGWSNFAHGRDPEEVMMTINQIMADVTAALRRYEAQSISWRGDGFLALVSGPDHARRAVDTSLDLVAAIKAFNEPRKLLGLPEFFCRIGISTGEVLLGNVGTYEKMDYSGVGTMMNLGARLEAKAEVGRPCISRTTYDLVAKHFRYAPGNPRIIDAKGIGEQMVWDVEGRAESTIELDVPKGAGDSGQIPCSV
jgi:class 3 adenylate cyclase/tetratricopeptide (TPR) repeat protein